MSKLRTAGVQHLGDVAVAIVEPRGTVTVVRRGETVDPRLLAGVRGLDRIPAEVLARD